MTPLAIDPAMRMTSLPVVVGSGWLGQALAASTGTQARPRRGIGSAEELPAGVPVLVASGRSSIARREDLPVALREELAHLRRVLDAAERAAASRIIVLGSSDVAGMAPEIRGTTPQDPRTVYAEVKAALEDECVLRHAAGAPVTCVRLAPVHGPGKARSRTLIRMSAWPVVPLPNGGRHSMGFVLLDDAIKAITWLAHKSWDRPTPDSAVVSVGGGPTPLCDLLDALASAQGRRLRTVAVPVLAHAGGRSRMARRSERLQWALRLASPRAVMMDPPVEITPLVQAADILVRTC